MHFSLAPLLALVSVLAVGSAQPVEARSTRVVLVAYYDLQIVVGSDYDQGPISDTYLWFGSNKNDDYDNLSNFDGDSISGKWKTLKASDTGFSADVEYKAAFDVGSYRSCTVRYNGVETGGETMAGDGHDVGEVSAKCVIHFDM